MDEPKQGAGEPQNAAPDDATASQKANGSGTAGDKSLEVQLADAKAEIAKNLEGWQRTAAEFANYRKRVDKERTETYQVASVDTYKKMLPAIDDFDRAIQSIPADQAKGAAYDGLKIIHRKLLSLLEAAGVKIINPAGEVFNPALHEAIGQDEGTGAASGTVTVVLQKGYVYGEKMLRPAMVRVAS